MFDLHQTVHMEEIIAALEESIQDNLLSRSEKKNLKTLIAEAGLDQDQLNFLRSKIFEVANAHVNESNYKLIMDWVKSTINATIHADVQHQSIPLFSPGEACREAIMRSIHQAVKTLYICVFTISDDAIASAILDAHGRGVAILIITDNDKINDIGSDIMRLRDAGINVRMDQTANHMHHKFMITDNRHLITGSYNWTRSAAKYNQENILLTDESGVVKAFLQEFNRLWPTMIPV